MPPKEYFSHDIYCTSNPKIEALIEEFGAEGYAFFWRIVEMLHANKEHKIARKKYLYIAISKTMKTTPEKINEFIDSCIDDYDLFKADSEFIWSERVFENIQKRSEVSEKRSISGKLGAQAKIDKAIAEQNLANAKQNKASAKQGKKSKVNESKEEEIKIEYNLIKGKNGVMICDVLRTSCLNFITDNPNLYPKEMFTEFLEFWSEEVKTGTPKWFITKKENDGVWSLPRRLSTWFKNYRPKSGLNQTQITPQNEIPERLRMQRI